MPRVHAVCSRQYTSKSSRLYAARFGSAASFSCKVSKCAVTRNCIGVGSDGAKGGDVGLADAMFDTKHQGGWGMGVGYERSDTDD